MRGLMILGAMIVAAIVFCGIIPFMVMPGAGVGVALPVIQMPGEIITDNFLGLGMELPNTWVGTILADVVVLAFVFAAMRGGLKMVPGRWQSMLELIADLWYSLAKSNAGERARKVFPLAITIFVFLLAANWVKLVPGVESIGVMHCAHEGISGYEKAEGILGIEYLTVDEALDSGARATHTNYELCKAKKEGKEYGDPVVNIAHEALQRGMALSLNESDWAYKGNLENNTTLAVYLAQQAEDGVDGVPSMEEVIENALPTFNREVGAYIDEHAAEAEGAEGAVEGEGADEEHADEEHAAEGDDEHHGLAFDAEYALEHPEEVLATVYYEGPYYRDDIYAVTPFVRGAATDLNLTIGLAVLAFLAIQYFGYSALGVSYFYKFINLPALENAGKNPGGLMDFVVGLLETISEFAKILSFGFRLFGNLFAGGILLIVMSFLSALLLPAGIYVLELLVGLIQAFIFAMLLLVFGALAMEGHHGDEADAHH